MIVRGLVLVGMALAWAWPLASHLRTAMPGGPTDLDVATMVWNVGFVARAFRTGSSLLETQMVLAPFGADLRLHTFGLLQGLAVAPLVPLLGALGAFNTMLLATLVLNGLLSYLLIARETGDRNAALVAATCFMLASPLLDQVRVGRPTFASLWIVCGALLALRALLETPNLARGGVLGVWLVAALLTDFQVVLFTALWLAIYGVWRIRPRHLPPIAVGLLTMGVPFGLTFYPALSAAGSSGYPQPTAADMAVYSFRVWDFADPEVIPHAYGFELGVAAVIALALARSLWLVGGLVALLLALGPLLQPTNLPLPFGLFSAWPPLAQFRTAYRLAMPAVLGLSVVLGVLLARLLARWPVSTRNVFIGMLVAARLAYAVVHDPLQTQTYPGYATYARLAREPGNATLLEVPFGVRSGLERIGHGGEVLQYYQAEHGKPLLNGMVARLPSSVFTGYRAHAALLLLSGEAVDLAEAQRDLPEVMEWASVGFMLVHHGMLEAGQSAAIDALLEREPRLERVDTEEDVVLYRVKRVRG